MDLYQLNFDDVQNAQHINSLPERTAFIDECGSFGFDFSKEGNSKYYILCAVIVENSKIDEFHAKLQEVKNNNGFSNSEMKSSQIGNNQSRRSRIISQLLSIEFKVILLIADKEQFIAGSPLTEYKKTFIKYLHNSMP